MGEGIPGFKGCVEVTEASGRGKIAEIRAFRACREHEVTEKDVRGVLGMTTSGRCELQGKGMSPEWGVSNRGCEGRECEGKEYTGLRVGVAKEVLIVASAATTGLHEHCGVWRRRRRERE